LHASGTSPADATHEPELVAVVVVAPVVLVVVVLAPTLVAVLDVAPPAPPLVEPELSEKTAPLEHAKRPSIAGTTVRPRFTALMSASRRRQLTRQRVGSGRTFAPVNPSGGRWPMTHISGNIPEP
jgi:hypothetical protein